MHPALRGHVVHHVRATRQNIQDAARDISVHQTLRLPKAHGFVSVPGGLRRGFSNERRDGVVQDAPKEGTAGGEKNAFFQRRA